MRSMTGWFAGIVLASSILVVPAEAKDISVLQQTGSAFADIAKQALPAVVFIDVESTVEVSVPQYRYGSPLEEFFGRGSPYGTPDRRGTRKYHQQGQGSGFIISKDGYILTNNHVVKGADRITVTLGDERKFDAKVVGTDPKTEVALIKIEDPAELPFLALGDSDALNVGEWVLAAGNPFGLSQTITAGIVSAKERSEVGITEYANFIQTDAAINPGNSGGPLLNIHGEVVGINTAIYSQTGGYMGIGFAIPINQAIAIKDQLIIHGSVRRSLLGVYIQDVDEALAGSFGMEEAGGVLISQVMADSAAEEAGLLSGDIVLELNDEKVGKASSFRSRVAAIEPGSEVSLKIFRNGKYEMLTAVTKAMDDEQVVDLEHGGSNILETLGLTVQDVDAETRSRSQLPDYGVLVSMVEQGSPAWRAGLRHGNVILSVNRERVDNVAEFRRMLHAAADAGNALFLVSDGRGTRFVVVSFE